MHCKIASKIEIEKTAGTTSDLIVNKIANRITKVLKFNHRIIHEKKIFDMIEKYIDKDIYIYISTKRTAYY